MGAMWNPVAFPHMGSPYGTHICMFDGDIFHGRFDLGTFLQKITALIAFLISKSHYFSV